MGRNSATFRSWDKDKRSSPASDASTSDSNTAIEQENRKHKDTRDTLRWNYIAFTPTSDPRHSCGAVATTLRSKLPKSSKDTGQPNSKRRGSSSSLDSVGQTMKRVRRSSRHTATPLPLLRHSYELKYMLEGHSHLTQHVRTNRSKANKTQKKYKGKKKESSKRRGRGRSQQTDDNGTDSDTSNSDDEDDSDNSNDDVDSLDIWSCEFEPSVEFSSTLVALCGGSSILFLDTQQGRYVKKYAHPEPLECFYTLAWTLLRGSRQLGRTQVDVDEIASDEDDDTYAAILAAAGKFGSIKLLEPTQTQCYRYLFGHEQPVLKLGFSKKEPRWLLSSSMDMTVRLWDIGTPSNGKDDSSCLAHFTVPGTSHPTSMSLSYDLSLLVVGTNKADLLQYKIDKQHIKKWQRDTYDAKPVSNDKDIKATMLKPRVKFPHGEEWHEGYVEDVYILGQDGEENSVADYVVSRGSKDMEILVWNPKKSTKADADIRLSLEWPECDGSTGMRFSVVEKDGQKLLLGGDSDGDIRLYNIGHGKSSKTLKDGSKELFDPVQVFSHERSTHLIRDVCISMDTKKFVAVDSNNTVFVWSSNGIPEL